VCLALHPALYRFGWGRCYYYSYLLDRAVLIVFCCTNSTPLYCTHTHTHTHTGGRILFMGSLSSVGPGPTVAVYAATKAFLQSFAMVRSLLTHTHTNTHPSHDLDFELQMPLAPSSSSHPCLFTPLTFPPILLLSVSEARAYL
jgi:hypothetical protein